ncbi:Gfo/Idh/MocA family protein, partial [Streptococcus pyogenes]
LYKLAKAKGTFLMAGFNRRFAPKVLDMKDQGDKRGIIVEKNDVNRPGDLQYKLFDFFIHPLDTALFLADDQPVSGS